MSYSLSGEGQISERLIRKLVRTWRCGGQDDSTAWLERRQRANRAVDVLKMFNRSSCVQSTQADVVDSSNSDEIDVGHEFRWVFVD